MNVSSLIEKWDGLLFQFYNFLLDIKYPFLSRKIRKTIKKNRRFRDIHKGERCFVVLNGPSINAHDLSFLENETVFASNYFFRSDICKVVKPNYYCWLDSGVFLTENYRKIFEDIRDVCKGADLFINSKGFTEGLGENCFFTYNRHMPNCYSIRTNISRICSNYSTVALYAISIAIYMGFKDIYVLGLDFEPGAFKHFTNLGEGTDCTDPTHQEEKTKVFGNYWSYAKSHSEFYKISQVAKKKSINIINLNKESCVRSFDFGVYEDLFQNE